MFKISNSISNKTIELTKMGAGSEGAGEWTKNMLYSFLKWLKNNRTSINGVKLFGLLILFWKIFMLEGINLVGNNVGLTKMQTVLMYLGLEMLSPSSSVVNTIESNTNNIGRTFFRQLGDKVLNLLDVLIEKNRQKYK